MSMHRPPREFPGGHLLRLLAFRAPPHGTRKSSVARSGDYYEPLFRAAQHTSLSTRLTLSTVAPEKASMAAVDTRISLRMSRMVWNGCRLKTMARAEETRTFKTSCESSHVLCMCLSRSDNNLKTATASRVALRRASFAVSGTQISAFSVNSNQSVTKGHLPMSFHL